MKHIPEEMLGEKGYTGTSIIRKKSVHLMKMKSHLPPLPTENSQYEKAMDHIRAFELEQLSLSFQFCTNCKERRLEMKMSSPGICHRCFRDKKTHKNVFCRKQYGSR